MLKSVFVVRAVLIVVVVALVIGVVTMMATNSASEKSNADVENAIKEQNMKNDEMKEILDPTNEADFKQEIAEKDLGYGKGDEKVYVSPDSGK